MGIEIVIKLNLLLLLNGLILKNKKNEKKVDYERNVIDEKKKI